MRRALAELVSEIEAAIARGDHAMDAAICAWEHANQGKRDGLTAALLTLVDEGVIHAVVAADRGARVRKVTSISAVVPALLKEHHAGAKREEVAMDEVERKRSVFVVHGRDLSLRDSMFHFLRSINLRPLEWSELTAATGAGSPYVGQVLDLAFERAQAIIIMLTPDENVHLSPRLGGGDEGAQARPNVIFEAGLALARNPQRTIIVEVGTLRPFSDIAGRHVVRLDDSTADGIAKRQELGYRLEQAGCSVSLRGSDWHRAGLFKIAGP